MSRRQPPLPTPPHKRHRSRPHRISRYLVVSGTMTRFDWGERPEPPEDFACAVYVDAWNRHEARHLACKTPEFSDWVDECRGDNRCPFAGLEVTELWPVLP